MNLQNAKTLLAGPLALAHLGLREVAEGAVAAGAAVHSVSFEPPAGGDPKRLAALTALREPALADTIDNARSAALERFFASQPQLVGVGVARDVIPHMAEDLFLHAGQETMTKENAYLLEIHIMTTLMRLIMFHLMIQMMRMETMICPIMETAWKMLTVSQDFAILKLDYA